MSLTAVLSECGRLHCSCALLPAADSTGSYRTKMRHGGGVQGGAMSDMTWMNQAQASLEARVERIRVSEEPVSRVYERTTGVQEAYARLSGRISQSRCWESHSSTLLDGRKGIPQALCGRTVGYRRGQGSHQLFMHHSSAFHTSPTCLWTQLISMLLRALVQQRRQMQG